MFFQTLVHGISKNEIRPTYLEKEEEGKQKRVNIERSKMGKKERSPNVLAIAQVDSSG